MQTSAQEAEKLFQDGVAALREGRNADARTHFERLTASGSSSGLAWMLLAMARGAEMDHAGEEEALNRLLEIEPQSVRGRAMKADCRARVGDESGACLYYKSAIGLAKGKQLPDEVRACVSHAEQALAELQSRGHAKREAKLGERGFPPEKWSPRFRHSLEIAAGRRQLYFQQPSNYTYPELPHVQFYDRSEFSWATKIESAAPAIRGELIELLKDGTDEFRAYIQAGSDSLRLDANKTLLDNEEWSALFLCENGWVVPKVVERCPRTWESVLETPVPRISGWGPTVMFSLLKAGARIAPHTGMFNMRLVCHLPLIVPPGCRFRVGNEVREWEEGKLLIFDDTIEHEAWNDGSQDRVILIFDIWRPELSEQEKQELTALFCD